MQRLGEVGVFFFFSARSTFFFLHREEALGWARQARVLEWLLGVERLVGIPVTEVWICGLGVLDTWSLWAIPTLRSTKRKAEWNRFLLRPGCFQGKRKGNPWARFGGGGILLVVFVGESYRFRHGCPFMGTLVWSLVRERSDTNHLESRMWRCPNGKLQVFARFSNGVSPPY